MWPSLSCIPGVWAIALKEPPLVLIRGMLWIVGAVVPIRTQETPFNSIIRCVRNHSTTSEAWWLDFVFLPPAFRRSGGMEETHVYKRGICI